MPNVSRLTFLRLTTLAIASASLRGRAAIGTRPEAGPVIHHLTDTHHPLDDGRLAAYVNAIRDGTLARPDLIVHGADLVNGAPTEAGLRAQLVSAKAILGRAGVPVHYVCHNHDRVGDPLDAAGRSFAEIIRQPFIQHVSVRGLEVYLVSGAITHPREYQPENYDGNPPRWGYDIYDKQVLASFERFIAANPGAGGRRILFTHHPIVPFDDVTSTDHPYAAFIRPYHVIQGEGRARILSMLRRMDIRHVFCGHCHFASRNVVEGVEFVTTPSFLRVRDAKDYPTGFRVITWRDGELTHAVHRVV